MIFLQATGTRFPGWIAVYVVLLAVLYLLMIRPQQVQARKRREMLGKLKKGDRVVTVGGLHATVHDLDESELTLELAPNLRVKADRGAISYVRSRKKEEAQPAGQAPLPPVAR